MNYRDLLKEYMRHVGDCEGTYYMYFDDPPEGVSTEQWIELNAIEAEVIREDEERLDAPDRPDASS